MNMDTERIKDYWIVESEYDLKVAWDTFNAGNYSYALFFGHLVIEKILKAIHVDRKKEHAPFIHNLLKLAEISEISIDQAQKDALNEITRFNLESRYPDDKKSFRKECTEDFTRKWMIEIEEIYKWLKSML
jgi:HEPN domain-containing protein